MTKHSLLALILAFTATIASAEIYTWKDSSGQIHYSDTPPAGVATKPTRSSPSSSPSLNRADSNSSAPTASSAPKEKSWVEKDQEFRQRRATEAEKATKQKEEDAKKQELAKRCENMRDSLAALENGARLGVANTKGQIEPMADDKRKAEANRLRTQITESCK